MLIFNPEMLHGTHLNTSGYTRLALSSRLNPRQPKFDPGCFYAREFWHSSRNVEQGRFDEVIRFARAENLETEAMERSTSCAQEPAPVVHVTGAADGEWRAVCPIARLQGGEKILVQVDGAAPILLLRSHERLHAVQARCPHLDIGLVDGYHDDENIWCPAHAIAFSLESGRSSCDALHLITYDVREEEGLVWLRS